MCEFRALPQFRGYFKKIFEADRIGVFIQTDHARARPTNFAIGQVFICHQVPITGSLQLPHIPATAFSQTDLFLVWIYLEFRCPQEAK